MPPKKSFKKRGGRRRGGKKSAYTRGGSGTTSALKTLTAPDRLIVKLPYYTDIPLKTTQTDHITYNFNLNSIYDPDRSGTGHQPLGYDQWGVFYNRYRVYGVQLDATFTNMSDKPVRVFNSAQNEVLVIEDSSMLEQSHVKSVQLGPVGSGKDTLRVKKFYSLPRITGRTATAYRADDRYGSIWYNNPAETIIGTLGALGLGGNNPDVLVSLRLVLMVECFDKHPMSISNTNPELRGPTATAIES